MMEWDPCPPRISSAIHWGELFLQHSYIAVEHVLVPDADADTTRVSLRGWSTLLLVLPCSVFVVVQVPAVVVVVVVVVSAVEHSWIAELR